MCRPNHKHDMKKKKRKRLNNPLVEILQFCDLLSRAYEPRLGKTMTAYEVTRIHNELFLALQALAPQQFERFRKDALEILLTPKVRMESMAGNN